MVRLLLCSLFLVGGLAAAEEITVYSARHYDADRELYDAFEKATGITVKVLEDHGDKLVARLKAEGDQTEADVLITVDAGRLASADAAGLFAPVESEILASRIPAHLRHSDGHWFAFGTRSRVIAYAKDRVDPATLSTYEALTDETWQGRILIRSSSNIYNQSLLASIIAAHGEDAALEWAKGMVANFARKPQGNDRAQIKGVAAGEGDVAIVNHYYLLAMKHSDDPEQTQAAEQVALFFPNQGAGERGAHINVSGAGMVAHASNPDGAKRFLEWLASDDGQRHWVAGSFEFPAAPDAPVPEELQQWEFRGDSVSAETLGELNRTAAMIFDAAGWP